MMQADPPPAYDRAWDTELRSSAVKQHQPGQHTLFLPEEEEEEAGPGGSAGPGAGGGGGASCSGLFMLSCGRPAKRPRAPGVSERCLNCGSYGHGIKVRGQVNLAMRWACVSMIYKKRNRL